MFRTKVLGNSCSDHWRKAQAIWFQNTLLLPRRVKSNSDQGFALLSSGEQPCPLSLSHGFSPYSHRQAGTRKRGQATFSVVLSMSIDFLFLREKVACPLFLRAFNQCWFDAPNLYINYFCIYNVGLINQAPTILFRFPFTCFRLLIMLYALPYRKNAWIFWGVWLRLNLGTRNNRV